RLGATHSHLPRESKGFLLHTQTDTSSETVSYTLTSSQISLRVQLVVFNLLQNGQHYVPSSSAVHLHHQVHSVVCVGLLQLSPCDLARVLKVVLKPLKFGPCEVVQSVPQHFPRSCRHCGVHIISPLRTGWGQAGPAFKKARCWGDSSCSEQNKTIVKSIILFLQWNSTLPLSICVCVCVCEMRATRVRGVCWHEVCVACDLSCACM